MIPIAPRIFTTSRALGWSTPERAAAAATAAHSTIDKFIKRPDENETNIITDSKLFNKSAIYQN